MSLETKQFNYLAWLTGVAVLVLLGGSLWALVTKQITYAVFAATIGLVVGPLVGWAAKGATVPKA
jgi:hypothetical protein